jgi:murein DD-endopeptidase MepM/ murein hydrolase activator NlpD
VLEVESVHEVDAALELASPSTAVIPVVESEPVVERAALSAEAVSAGLTESSAAASRRERRAGETSGRRARPIARAVAAPTARVASEPVAAATPRSGGRRAMRAVVAMGFAATLALATSVPALSLLTPADVQAAVLAAESVGGTTKLSGPLQRVEIDGDVIASPTVEREGYQHQSIEEYARAAGIRAEATFTNNPSGTIQWPFAVGVHIGDRFGYRSCAGCSSNHGGQDFNPGLGAEIQAIADGVVSNSTDAGGSLGVVMMIDHVIDGETVTSVYAHMETGSRRFELGDTVKVGDVVGTTGTTGMSTGPHLHFEIRLGGINGTKTDPLVWLYENTN